MVTQAELKDLLDYDLLSGEFRYKKDIPCAKIKAGDLAGYKIRSHTEYYLCIHIKGHLYRLSHLAFLYVLNRLPIKLVDHHNLNKLDNSWFNLREATAMQNSHNYPKPSTNTSGIKGLYYRKDGIQVRVMYNQKAYTAFFSLKKYQSFDKAKEKAISYLLELRNLLHKDFANHG